MNDISLLMTCLDDAAIGDVSQEGCNNFVIN